MTAVRRRSSRIAAVWRKVCMVIRLRCRDRYLVLAVARRCSRALRLESASGSRGQRAASSTGCDTKLAPSVRGSPDWS
jgi:hypothetical protein